MVAPGMAPFAPSVDAARDLALALLDYIEKKHGRQGLLDYVRIDPPGAQIPALHGAVVRGYHGVLAALIEKRVDHDQKISIPSLKREWTALHRRGARDRLADVGRERPARRPQAARRLDRFRRCDPQGAGSIRER